MAIETRDVPPPDPTWPLDELKAYERMSANAKIVCHKMGVKPTQYFATMEAETITRRATGLPPLPVSS